MANVPSAQPPGEESQRTLLLDGGRYMKAGMAVVLEALSLPSFALEPAGHRVILCNGALARLLNYSQGEGGAVPSALSQLWDGPLPAGLLVEGAEGNARRSDGCPVPARLTIRPLRLSGALGPLLLGTLEDLRPLREMQRRLVDGERLRAQGALVAGVVHEVNNPASLLLANMQELEQALSQLLPAALGPLEERLLRDVAVMLTDAREGTQRIVDVVRDLVQLSHPAVGVSELVDLGQLCEVVLRLARPLLIGVRVERDLRPAPLVAHRAKMFQVLLNLLINAVHAVEEVPEVRRSLSLRLRALRRGEQDGVHLAFEDTGCGIPEALLERIFEPFFTTKGAGRGTGLGLSLSRTIVEQHGGTLTVSSRVGQGTQVALWLPSDRRS